MIAFDTNVLLRLLIVDDKVQAKRAKLLLKRVNDANDRVLLPDIVLCELTWVLKSIYGQSKSEIVEVLHLLLETEPFSFANRSVVSQALAQFETGSADFSDYMIGWSATASRATTTYTFDTALKRNAMFAVLASL